ncbi:uncharacterized protein CG7065-like isoform X2 [Nymphalis io]|uniref:uncharacterized protein CG7065-like isoform X2 n=1 Tax=Inachis io TaxID=171585 RepID=UPI0021677A18|nr:uncharacterized protein CG7065-like isoform X2 [Nymphalis io]
MDLPDCPPGAEGYEDSVTEVPKKLEIDESSSICTKAEQEFQQHLNSLKIETEDGSFRCMVERRGRDISGKWIYLCYPCAAMCSGESILQTHISGKKHKTKISMKNVWPLSIFEEHPYILNEKGNTKSAATEKVLQKMAEEVEIYKKNPTELDLKYDKYRNVVCHIQETLDNVKAPLLGIEYLVEHPPEQAHYEPSYICVLCIKQGYPRTIVNHLTCFWHRYNYLLRHFSKACTLLTPYRGHAKYREGVAVIMNRLATRIQDKYGRLRPINIDKEEYEKDRNQIHQWIFRGFHFCETDDCTFEEVVDADLINSLDSSTKLSERKTRDPSPPVVAAPSKPPNYNARRAAAADALSDVSDEPEPRGNSRSKLESKRYEPYPDKRIPESSYRSRFAIRNSKAKSQEMTEERPRAPNYEYKVKLAAEQRDAAEELARKALAYHEKNPEKHPFYPDEWKKFWNRRYKEIQAEGKDPSKHDFKPEWIVFWTGRMKELHEEELRATVTEIYRRMRLTPPDRVDDKKPQERRKTPDHRRTPDRHRSSDRRRSPEYRHRSPLSRRRSPEPRRRSPRHRKISPEAKRRIPDYRERRSPERRSQPRRRSPLRSLRTRSRSPIHKAESSRRGVGAAGAAARRARSPLSRRASAPRNHSPARALLTDTVLISDEELKPDDGLSPWNSDDSLGSLPDARSPIAPNSRTGSVVSRNSRRPDIYRDKASAPQDFGSAENVVATLRLLVALEDYLGSLGPKIVDLLTEALKMEKDRANSSEELLVTEAAVVLIETAKEKLKGAVQAGLVAGSAAAAVRSAVVRAAATLHEADTRMKKRKQQEALKANNSSEAVPVAGVGAVDREQIAQQMAAALIAQGKTDVSSEELAHLVDAVVGMAEAKRREADSKRKTEAGAANDKSTRTATGSTASALQMLQSAYDDKKAEKEDVPDAMDGLSDSDLETLLKNFNELSAEEQHSLIAYLKKLEAREPQRVERLRQYVGAAATNAPTTEEKTSHSVEDKPLNIASDDDDDYTVEDVFKSATQKVKEDQIRQEMEIVKKSLEESKASPEVVESTITTASSNDVKKDIFSATDLLALVQASLQSTPAPTSNPAVVSDVVTSNTQPRSFGDLPEPSLMEKPNPLLNPQQLLTQTMSNQQGLLRTPNIPSYSGNHNNLVEVRTPVWEPRQTSDMSGQVNIQHDNLLLKQPQDSYNKVLLNSGDQNPRGSQDSYIREKWEHQGNINQGSRNDQGNFHQVSQGVQDNYNQGVRGSQENYNQGSPGSQDNNYNKVSQGPQDMYLQGLRGAQEIYNQGSRGPSDNYNQGSRGSQEIYNQGSRGPQDNCLQGSRGFKDNYNLGYRGTQDIYNNQKSFVSQDKNNPGPRGPQDNYNQGTHGPQDSYNQGQHGPQENFNQGTHGPQDNYNQGQHGPQDNYNQVPRGLQDSYNPSQNNFNQGLRKPQDNYNQGLPSLLDNFKPELRGQDQTYGAIRGTNNNSFNQGIRGNFMGNRMQDNFNNRQDVNQMQQFSGQIHGNFEKNNFRGRGRGFAKQTRGRGRGFY